MILDKLKLDDSAALVTGGSRGIGRGAALALAEAGADVAVSSRHLSDLKLVTDEIQRLGRRALAVETDVSKEDQVKKMIERVLNEFGKIDILVNAAGTITRAPAVEYSLSDWNLVIDVNLKGTFICCQEVGRHMISRRRGKIINVASLLSAIGVPNIPAYAGSKGGVASITRCLAVEWAKYGVNVNAIGPGYIRTELTKALQENKERSAQILSRIPMGRWGLPEDLQGAFVFLASPASDYITGQILWVDGGWMAG